MGANITRPKGLTSPTFLQASLGHLGTAFENLLDQQMREKRNHERQMENKMRRNVSLAFQILERSRPEPIPVGGKGRFRKAAPAIPLCTCDRSTRYLRRQCQRRHGIAKRYRKEGMNEPSGIPGFEAPVMRFFHSQTQFSYSGGLPEAITVPHPFQAGAHITVHFPRSNDEDYREKLTELATSLKTQASAVEFHRRPAHHGILRWYAHITINREVKPSSTEIKNVLGIHLGERDTATTALVSDGKIVGPARLKQGRNLRHELERLYVRRRELRRADDRGSKEAKFALQAILQKEKRMRQLEAHTVSKAIIDRAVKTGANALATENLSDRFPRLEEVNVGRGADSNQYWRDWNRRTTGWNRGAIKDYLRYKAEAAGLRLAGKNGAGVSPWMDSHTCPRCGTMDPDGRSRKERLFTCPKCGPINDDVGAAMIVAQRGHRYFNSPKKKPKDPKPEGREPDGNHTAPPSSEGDRGSSRAAILHPGGANPRPPARRPTEGRSPATHPARPEIPALEAEGRADTTALSDEACSRRRRGQRTEGSTVTIDRGPGTEKEVTNISRTQPCESLGTDGSSQRCSNANSSPKTTPEAVHPS
jgi:hypothetical protein